MIKVTVSVRGGRGGLMGELKSWEPRVNKMLTQYWANIREVAAKHVLRETPVDTGFLRNHWVTGLRSDSGRFVKTSARTPARIAGLKHKVTNYQRPGKAEIDDVLSKTAGIKPFKSFWFILKVEYAEMAKYHSRRKHFDTAAAGKIKAQLESERNRWKVA